MNVKNSLFVGIYFFSSVFPAQALDDRVKEVLQDTFIPPKIVVQQLLGQNPNLTPLIQKRYAEVFSECFRLKHLGKDGNFVNTLVLKADAACYALQAQKTEIQLGVELARSQPVNQKVMTEGMAQVVGSIALMAVLGRCLPHGYGLRLFTMSPLFYSTVVGAAKIYNGAHYQEYLQERIKSNNEIKNLLAKVVVE